MISSDSPKPGIFVGLTIIVLLTAAATVAAKEVQLAGIRLGQHALHVMQIYGQPDGIIKGGGEAGIGAGQAPPAPGVAGGAGMMGPGGPAGMGAQMPGMGPAGAAGPEGMMGMPGSAGPGPAGQMPGMGPGAGMGLGPGAGMGAGPAGVGQAAAAGAASPPQGGGVGLAPPGPNPFFNPNVPDWAGPVWVPMRPEESEWVYRRGSVVQGFVMDRDGYIVSIVVSGRECDWARTAMGDPHRAVKLGDEYDRVIARYGYPTETDTYSPVEKAFAGGAASPPLGGIGNASRDLILHYGYNDNVEFLMRDMKVRRIHIWEPRARPPEPRMVGAGGAAGAGGMGGGGMGPGMMGGGAGMPGGGMGAGPMGSGAMRGGMAPGTGPQ